MNKPFLCLSVVIASCLLILSGCGQPKLSQDPIRICDEHGCAERPSNYTSYDPNAAVPDDDPTGKIAALENLAKQDPRAAFDLGLRFFRGDGIRQDSYRALKWMRDAAERGNLEAQKAVGRLYLTGLGEMGSDPREAEKWLTIAAGRGDKEAAKLLKEAEQARKNEDSYYRWKNQWRPYFYNSWYSGYHYYWNWGVNNRWYLY